MSSALKSLLTLSRDGIVAGVYSSCFNVCTDDGLLFTIFPEKRKKMTTGLYTDFPSEESFLDYGIENGMGVCIENKIITIPQVGFICDISDAQPVQMEREPLPYVSPHCEIERKIKLVTEIITAEGSQSGAGRCKNIWWQYLQAPEWELPDVEDELCKRIFRGMRDLLKSIAVESEAAIKGKLRGVIGLGSGLTPSSDDMVCGMAAWLYMYPCGKKLWAAFFHALKTFLYEEGKKRTTLVSRTLLSHAASGILSDPLYELVSELLCGTDQGCIVKAARQMLKYGSGSGTETCLGIIAGYVITTLLRHGTKNRVGGYSING